MEEVKEFLLDDSMYPFYAFVGYFVVLTHIVGAGIVYMINLQY